MGKNVIEDEIFQRYALYRKERKRLESKGPPNKDVAAYRDGIEFGMETLWKSLTGKTIWQLRNLYNDMEGLTPHRPCDCLACNQRQI